MSTDTHHVDQFTWPGTPACVHVSITEP